MKQKQIDINSVVVDGRHRKDLGNVQELANSIREIGLLHPIVVRCDMRLVVGERRLAAYRLLAEQDGSKWSKIAANVTDAMGDIATLVKAECQENTCRKAFTPEEAVAIGEAIEATLPKPEERKAEARRRAKGKKKDGASCAILSKPKRDNGKRTASIAAAAVGMSARTYEKAKEVVNASKKSPKAKRLVQEMNKTGKVNGAHKKLKVAKQKEEIAKEPPPLPTGPFRVIVVDPPWHYDKRPDDPTHRGALPYPSMTLEQIKSLSIANMAHENCVLWLWTTNSHIMYSFEIAEAWGFTYKTLLTWVKDKMGLGDWLRGQTEHCLMCVRGKPTIDLTNQTTVIHGPLREHSQKPDEFYAMVERLCPGSKVEVFSRTNREGWTTHGDETGSIRS